ncbi:MAG: protease modulator HflC [Acidobacteriota bacterium]
MKRLGSIGGLILLILLVIVLNSIFFVVDETQQVIITQFGEPVGEPITSPGLHIKIPFIQKANYFDKRFLEWDGDPNQVPTKDKRFIWVDTYARWRITDPLKFFQRLRDERGAQSRLDDILDGETRNAVARQNLVEVVRSTNRDPESIPLESDEERAILEAINTGREAITREILERSQERAADLGIEIIDVRFKRINYVEEVQKDVFERMIAERKRVAQRYRSEGEGEAARIRGEKERDLAQIRSEAYRRAQEIRGRADAEATAIYADAYNRDVRFYTFLKSLETYEATADPSSILILTTDAELLRTLKQTP